MDLAVAQKIILTNPTNARELPKVEHKEMQTVPAEQLRAFLEEAKRSGVYEMYYIELATGLRRGELPGPKWQDIDWKNGVDIKTVSGMLGHFSAYLHLGHLRPRHHLGTEGSRPDYGKCAECLNYAYMTSR